MAMNKHEQDGIALLESLDDTSFMVTSTEGQYRYVEWLVTQQFLGRQASELAAFAVRYAFAPIHHVLDPSHRFFGPQKTTTPQWLKLMRWFQKAFVHKDDALILTYAPSARPDRTYSIMRIQLCPLGSFVHL